MTPLESNGTGNKILGTYDIHRLDDNHVLPRLRSDRENFVRMGRDDEPAPINWFALMPCDGDVAKSPRFAAVN